MTDTVLPPYPEYRPSQRVRAFQIAHCDRELGVLKSADGTCEALADKRFFDAFTPQVGDWLVVDEEGHRSVWRQGNFARLMEPSEGEDESEGFDVSATQLDRTVVQVGGEDFDDEDTEPGVKHPRVV